VHPDSFPGTDEGSHYMSQTSARDLAPAKPPIYPDESTPLRVPPPSLNSLEAEGKGPIVQDAAHLEGDTPEIPYSKILEDLKDAPELNDHWERGFMSKVRQDLAVRGSLSYKQDLSLRELHRDTLAKRQRARSASQGQATTQRNALPAAGKIARVQERVAHAQLLIEEAQEDSREPGAHVLTELRRAEDLLARLSGGNGINSTGSEQENGG